MSDQGLEAIKAQMSEQQRRDMAELIGNELKRREEAKRATVRYPTRVSNSSISSGLGTEQVGEMYGEVDDKVRALRLKKIERELAEARRLKKRLGGRGKSLKFTMPPMSRNVALFGVIVLLGAAKIMFESGLVDASTVTQAISKAPQIMKKTEAVALPNTPSVSATEQELLSKLDARRVELENRRSLLDSREAELKRQMAMVTEKLAELRSLTSRMGEKRVRRDQRYEARMEQLANVYGSMAPVEAAPLIARLDDDIALALLQRFPGKRMGQVLSAMNSERAIELTLLLTDRNSVE